ncbi:MAG: hypothetical protein JST55_02945 [Bacteroidetes bacterium]|nr:hypothetical protein [Bacteroidota bacterium]
MAKTSTQKVSSKTETKAPDLDKIFEKYFWLIIPILAVIYFIVSKSSTGFYQDDEMGHYLNMRDFWTHPGAILGNWPKTGYKLVMVIPSLMGYQGVLFFNSLIASVTVFMTYVLLKEYKIKYAFFGALLLALQPLYFDLSFRSYAEIFSGLLLIFVIYFYKKDKLFLSGLILGYLFTVRQEVALLGLILAVMFVMRKNYLAIISLGIFPLLYMFAGYLQSGDIMFIINEMKNVGEMDFGGANRGALHYFKVYIFIIGPICLALFLSGYLGFIGKNTKEYFKRFDLIYIVFTLMFLVPVALMLKGVNPGTWRYLIPVSPLAAFFATVGLNNLADAKFKSVFMGIIGVLALLTLGFLSHTSNGLDVQDPSEFTKILCITLFFVATLVISRGNIQKYLNTIAIVSLILAAGYLFMNYEPRKLNPENEAIIKIGEYVNTPEIKDKNVYYTNSNILFFGDVFGERGKKFQTLNMENLSKSPKGSIIIWDTHYGYRPEYKKDVKLDVLKDSTNYKLLNQFMSTDRKFAAYAFEKLN